MILRRKFIKKSSLATLGLMSGLGAISCKESTKVGAVEKVMESVQPWFKQSLAQWSVNKELFGGQLNHLDFAKYASDLGFTGIEYVSAFFKDRVEDMSYLKTMNEKASEFNVEQLLIMVDGEGDLASAKKEERMKTVANHQKWLNAAKELGCHSIRVNLFGELYDKEKWIEYASDGLSSLTELGKQQDINVIVENHGWLSSHAPSLVQVMKNVNMDHCGTLPDFGNFCVKRPDGKKWGPECEEEYDKYKGVDELMPYAKAVSAKSYDFGDDGKETTIDFAKMMEVVKRHGYTGYVGTEYEGERLDAKAGIVATRDLLSTLNV